MAIRLFTSRARKCQAAVFCVAGLACLGTGTLGGVVIGGVFLVAALGCYRKARRIQPGDTVIFGGNGFGEKVV